MASTSASNFSAFPELELVLCCARTNIDTGISNRVKELINQGIEWSKVIDIAASSKVTPLLYRNLKLTHPGDIPDFAMEQLKQHFSNNLHENLHLFGELQSILRLFESNNIPTICYKGPAFAIWLYGDLSLRSSGDLDILVQKKDVARAKDLLLSVGYKLYWPNIPLTNAQEASHVESKYNYSFLNEFTGIVIELHWGITPKYFSFPPEPEWLWEKLAPLNIAGTQILTFSPEDYLLILCVHSSNHCWIRLSWICDISELINNHPELNWEYILHVADSFGIKRILLLGLLITHEFLGTNLNPEIIELADSDSRVRILEKQVVLKYLNSDYIGSRSFEIPIFHLKMRERLFDKLHYCISMSNPSSKDWATFPGIQPNSVILSFVLRPLRLIMEHGFDPITGRRKNRISDQN